MQTACRPQRTQCANASPGTTVKDADFFPSSKRTQRGNGSIISATGDLEYGHGMTKEGQRCLRLARYLGEGLHGSPRGGIEKTAGLVDSERSVCKKAGYSSQVKRQQMERDFANFAIRRQGSDLITMRFEQKSNPVAIIRSHWRSHTLLSRDKYCVSGRNGRKGTFERKL
jgi:hypothetical protein